MIAHRLIGYPNVSGEEKSAGVSRMAANSTMLLVISVEAKSNDLGTLAWSVDGKDAPDITLARDPETGEAWAFSLVRSVADESELLLIATLPDRHRQGIGKQLLDRFLDQAQEGGIARVHLEVRDGNPAVRMYQSAGFVQVGRRRNYYHAANGERYDALTLSRDT